MTLSFMLSSTLFRVTHSEAAILSLVLGHSDWLKHVLVTLLLLRQNTRWKYLKEGGTSLGSQFQSAGHHRKEVMAEEHDQLVTLHPPTVGLFSLLFSPELKPTEWCHLQSG